MDLPFNGRTGRGVRIAVIDSGVNAAHPHISRVAGGVTIGDQSDESQYIDLLGHGTAVMAAIQEKAPEADYFAVRVFYNSLRTSIAFLVKAIEWCLEKRVQVINLSLGTPNPAHRERFLPLIARAAEAGAILVSAGDASGTVSLPGSLPGVIGVSLDWDCPRDSYYLKDAEWCASGYPRSLPGLPRERNLHGISFAVANMSGFVARVVEGLEQPSYEKVCAVLAADERRFTAP
jgi:subtilisin family serine protease